MTQHTPADEGSISTELLLELTITRFLHSGEWPNIHEFQRWYHRQGGKGSLVNLAHSLPNHLGRMDLSTRQFHPSIAAMTGFPKARPLLLDFVRTVQLSVSRYLGDAETPTISKADLMMVLDSGAKGVDLVRMLLREEGFLWSGWTEVPEWSMVVSENIHMFQGVETIEDYLRVRETFAVPLQPAAFPIFEEVEATVSLTTASGDVPALHLADLHPAIREACGSLFEAKKYRQGVFDAFLALRDLVRDAAALPKPDGDNLMGAAFNEKSPAITLADLSSDTGMNRQRGARMLAQGVVAALRNPYSHNKDEIGLAEAMESVGVMSLLARWIDARP